MLKITKMAALAAVGAILASNCVSAAAGDSSSKESPFVKLEKTFWICDHAATKGMIDINQAAVCGSITDELRREKFDGDFEKLLAWWRLNKVAEHQKLDQAHIAEFDSPRPSVAS